MNVAISTRQSDFVTELESHVKTMYRAVALYPESAFHFEMGRTMAERLGYDPRDLDRIPAASIESFAGVGYHFALADLQKNQFVVDLGSGSGMDTFIASNKVGHGGSVVGIDMTDEQRNKASYLRDSGGFCNVSYKKAYIEDTGLPGGLYHTVISNGVVNLAADKPAVFKEAYRLLRSGGRLALSDIVTEKALPERITCDATLWAACIGGAMQQDEYIAEIEKAGFRVVAVRDNTEYHFISGGATWATETYGVKSISLLAVKD
ncbi:MAG: methyltransferase domain-containing protein [Gammaproteobacteria bacterium]|nr:methyltransferase domain-containing protein [Gammaproteobacteria bacterium]